MHEEQIENDLVECKTANGGSRNVAPVAVFLSWPLIFERWDSSGRWAAAAAHI
jgi:hypothetical protein